VLAGGKLAGTVELEALPHSTQPVPHPGVRLPHGNLSGVEEGEDRFSVATAAARPSVQVIIYAPVLYANPEVSG